MGLKDLGTMRTVVMGEAIKNTARLRCRAKQAIDKTVQGMNIIPMGAQWSHRPVT